MLHQSKDGKTLIRCPLLSRGEVIGMMHRVFQLAASIARGIPRPVQAFFARMLDALSDDNRR